MEDNPNDCVYISFPSSNARDVRQFCVSTTEIPYQVREWAKSQSKDVQNSFLLWILQVSLVLTGKIILDQAH